MNERPDNNNTPLLEARGLTLRFPGQDRPAVDGVSFSMAAGRTVGLVGASGAGKSSIARMLLGLHEPDAARQWLTAGT